MGVRIKKKLKEKMQGSWILFLAALFLACLWFQRSAIWETGPALETMAESIKAGEPMGEALEAFLERNLS